MQGGREDIVVRVVQHTGFGRLRQMIQPDAEEISVLARGPEGAAVRSEADG